MWCSDEKDTKQEKDAEGHQGGYLSIDETVTVRDKFHRTDNQGRDNTMCEDIAYIGMGQEIMQEMQE